MLPKIHRAGQNLEQAQHKVVAYKGVKKSIMVVDDDINQHRLMNDLLSPLGFNVLLASGAEDGFKILATNTIDLVILDVRMPIIDGWQMVKLLREQQYFMPVLMVSANARDTEFNLAAEGLHDGYIAKPVNLDALLDKIEHLLAIQWQYQELSEQGNVEGCVDNTAKQPINSEHYEALMALAEIGYLSGFKDKLTEIAKDHVFPSDVYSQINEYIQQCNFPKIIEYLRELNHE